MLLFLSLPLSLQALSNPFEKIENKVFKENSVEYVQSFLTGGVSELDRFQDGLVYYRLGNITTNRAQTERAISTFESLLSGSTNVYSLSYLGLGFSSLARFEKGMSAQISQTKKALAVFNRAIELYPDHYLPRLYRGLILLFLPGIMGGNEKQGRADMAIVLAQLEGLSRDGDYKSFVYFMYASYWGYKKKYQSALDYAAKALPLAKDERMVKAIMDKQSEWQSKIK